MMTRRFLAPVLLTCVICTPAWAAPTPSPAKLFVREVKSDIFGYLMPEKDLRAGRFVFRNIALGSPVEFQSYETGKNDIPTYAPFMLEFDDVTSKTSENELGQMAYAVAPRVLPTFYVITSKSFAFWGTEKTIGAVSFKGVLDLAAMKAAKDDQNKIVATGDLTFGGKTFKNVKLTWFGGD